MRLLELFCGGKSVSKVAKEFGYECVSVDILEKLNPDVCCDIRQLDYWSLGEFDVVWASPPCTEFSFAKTVGERKLDEAMELVRKAAEIIAYINPKYYVIENPVGLLRQFLPANDRVTVSYCRYGYAYRKNTDLWTDVPFEPRRCVADTLCDFKREFGIHGQYCQKGRKTIHLQEGGKKIIPCTGSILDRYSLPSELLRDIFRAITVSLRIRIKIKKLK